MVASHKLVAAPPYQTVAYNLQPLESLSFSKHSDKRDLRIQTAALFLFAFWPHRAAPLGTFGDLPHRALDVFRQDLRRFVPALGHDQSVLKLGVAHLSKPAAY